MDDDKDKLKEASNYILDIIGKCGGKYKELTSIQYFGRGNSIIAYIYGDKNDEFDEMNKLVTKIEDYINGRISTGFTSGGRPYIEFIGKIIKT